MVWGGLLPKKPVKSPSPPKPPPKSMKVKSASQQRKAVGAQAPTPPHGGQGGGVFFSWRTKPRSPPQRGGRCALGWRAPCAFGVGMGRDSRGVRPQGRAAARFPPHGGQGGGVRCAPVRSFSSAALARCGGRWRALACFAGRWRVWRSLSPSGRVWQRLGAFCGVFGVAGRLSCRKFHNHPSHTPGQHTPFLSFWTPGRAQCRAVFPLVFRGKNPSEGSALGSRPCREVVGGFAARLGGSKRGAGGLGSWLF